MMVVECLRANRIVHHEACRKAPCVREEACLGGPRWEIGQISVARRMRPSRLGSRACATARREEPNWASQQLRRSQDHGTAKVGRPGNTRRAGSPEISPVWHVLCPGSLRESASGYCVKCIARCLGSVQVTYPISASWVWGRGWLQKLGFVDSP